MSSRIAGVCAVLLSVATWAAVFGNIRGIVHDPDHRPMQKAQVVVKSSSSDYSQQLTTDTDGAFEATALPVGSYDVTVTAPGFASSRQQIVVSSGSAPVVHFQLAIGARTDQVTVAESALAVSPEQMTPTTIVSRNEIAMTPGADLSNSLTAITDYVHGAWVTHDQLHVRGGHQATWAIEAFPSPTPTSRATSGLRSTPRISTIWRRNAAATPPHTATARTASSTLSREQASSAAMKPSCLPPSAHFTRLTIR